MTARKGESSRGRRLLLLLATLILSFALAAAVTLRGPRRVAPAARERAAELFRQAMGQSEGGDLRTAAANLEEAVRLLPGWPDARIQLGTVYYQLHEFALARRALEQSAVLVPREPTVWWRLGRLYLATGELDRALGAFTRAIELDPTRPAYYTLLAETHLRRGDPASLERGMAACERALAIEAGHAGALHRRGLIHQRRGRWDAAAADLTQAIRADPTVPEPYYALSQVERRRGNKAAADRAAREFKRLDLRERSQR